MKTSRFDWIGVAVLCASAAVFTPARLAAADTATDPVQLLFVQSAEGMAYDQGTLTLKNFSPTTLFFSDRPARIAGHYTTEDMKIWTEGKDDFLQDPPNAVVRTFEMGKPDPSDVVVTLTNPRASGKDMVYDVKVIKGTPPATGGATSVFIDIIGMPATPISYAGAARLLPPLVCPIPQGC